MKTKAKRMMFWGAATLLLLVSLSYLTRPSRVDVVTYTADKVWVKVHGPLFSLCESTDQLFHQSVHVRKGS